MPIVLQLDTALFTQILAAEHEGLQSLDAPLAAQCAMTIDHLATYYFTKASKGEPAVRALQGHLQVTLNLVTLQLTCGLVFVQYWNHCDHLCNSGLSKTAFQSVN
jgi:hypothetical protein